MILIGDSEAVKCEVGSHWKFLSKEENLTYVLEESLLSSAELKTVHKQGQK